MVEEDCHEQQIRYERAEGKRHNAAVMCLARRGLNVLFAMAKQGSSTNRNPRLLLDNECNGGMKPHLPKSSHRRIDTVSCPF